MSLNNFTTLPMVDVVDLSVDCDRVTIERVTIYRPARIGVVQWFAFWEGFSDEESYSAGYQRGYHDGTLQQRGRG